MRTAAKKAERRVFYSNRHSCCFKVVSGRLLPFKEGVDLFNARGKWWLSYGFDRNTGSFKTKTRAMSWHDHGGR